MEAEIKALKEELMKMAWFMRGGMTLEEAYNLDFQEREIIAGIIKENLETTKKTGLSFF